MQIEKITKIPAEVQAADALRKAIVSGNLPAGSRITEGALSEQMQLSRATIRSALHLLASEGLTVLRRYSGWYVVTLSARDVRELYSIRSVLERLGARLAATDITPGGAKALKAALQLLVRRSAGEDLAAIADADFRFHRQIIILSRNERLIALYDALEPQIRMYLAQFNGTAWDRAAIVADHGAIAEAVLQGDAERAGELSERHTLVDGEPLARQLEANDAAR